MDTTKEIPEMVKALLRMADRLSRMEEVTVKDADLLDDLEIAAGRVLYVVRTRRDLLNGVG